MNKMVLLTDSESDPMPSSPMPSVHDNFCGTSYAAKLLGLSVGTVQALVEKNELQAWKTQGGHRRISLPSIREYQRRHQHGSHPVAVPSRRLQVMVVDDDALTRTLLQEVLGHSSLPIDCICMASGLEALIDMSSIQPDVLLLDLRMPGVDGFELLRTVRANAQFARMTTVVMSAMTPEEIAARGGLPPETQFMAKPLNLAWLSGFLTALMGSKVAQAATAFAP